MKPVVLMSAAFAVVLAIAGCSDSDHTHANGETHSHGEDGHSHADGCGNGEHGHSHEGERIELGSQKHEGGWEVHASHIGEIMPGGEGVFEVKVLQDGKTASDAKINVWLADSNGEGLTPKAGGNWVEGGGLFDCHLNVPEGMPEGTHLMVRVRMGDTDFTKEFGIGASGSHEHHEDSDHSHEHEHHNPPEE